jgi:hypothetical protein
MDITNTRSEHPEAIEPESAHVCEWCGNWGFVIVPKRLDMSDGTNSETVDCGCRCHTARSSWWQCKDEEFTARQAQEQPRMLGLDERHRLNLQTAVDARRLPSSYPETELE